MKGRSALVAGFIACMALQGALQRAYIFDKWSSDYKPKSEGIAMGLAPDQLLAALAGFREMVAGILWVKADSFFDTGNYDAVLPLIRIVTWLDPHQLDVYSTGMWHIAYNFTDEQHRSDRRYIPYALALGKEGSRLNPNTYEMFFETGWIWFHKIDDDYFQAVKWFEQARQRPDMLQARQNILSSALQRDGKIEEALKLYYELFDIAQKKVEQSDQFSLRQVRDTLETNTDNLLVRMSQRGYFAMKDGAYDQGNYDTKPPFDVGFSVRATVEESKKIRFEGTWNVLPVGTRIRVVLRDKNYPGAKFAELDWDGANKVELDPPKDLTFMQDQLFVKNRRFNRLVDMSKDLTMYPFKSEDYWLEFYYNARSAPAHIQDKFGWSGEGMTDKSYMNTEVRPGQKVLYCRLPITRSMILRRGEWVDKSPIVETPNYKSSLRSATGEQDVIMVPGLRAGDLKQPGEQKQPTGGK